MVAKYEIIMFQNINDAWIIKLLKHNWNKITFIIMGANRKFQRGYSTLRK